MKANQRLTALEVLKEAGSEFQIGEETMSVNDVIGKVRVRIGGIPVNSPDQLVFVQPSTDSLDVIVGNERFEIDTTENEEVRTVSDDAKEVLESRKQESSEVESEESEETSEETTETE